MNVFLFRHFFICKVNNIMQIYNQAFAENILT